MAVLVEKY